jgi:hypothetical protein
MTKVLASQKFQGHARRFEDFGLKHKLAVFVRGQTRLNKRMPNLDSTHQLAGYARHVVDERPPLVVKALACLVGSEPLRIACIRTRLVLVERSEVLQFGLGFRWMSVWGLFG